MSNSSPVLTLLLIVPLVFASWFLVHLLAFLGVFLAVAYPLWWAFAPSQTVCFLCRAERNRTQCPFCRQIIAKEISVAPKTFASAILNGLLILVFSVFSAGIVFGESRLLSKFGFPPTPKTVSFIIPTKGQYRLGEIFPMKIEITGIKTAVNAVQADLGFEANKLEVESVSTEGSFANIFVQKEVNNTAGYVRLTGGLPNPGFLSDRGVFGTVFFKAKEPGVVTIEYLPSSLVLANDGRGTNVLKDLASVSYLILPERISEEEEERQSSIKLSSTVLGEKSDNTQMKFYEEEMVLGTSIGQPIPEEKKFKVFEIFLIKLEKVDSLIMKQWGKVFK